MPPPGLRACRRDLRVTHELGIARRNTRIARGRVERDVGVVVVWPEQRLVKGYTWSRFTGRSRGTGTGAGAGAGAGAGTGTGTGTGKVRVSVKAQD